MGICHLHKARCKSEVKTSADWIQTGARSVGGTQPAAGAVLTLAVSGRVRGHGVAGAAGLHGVREDASGVRGRGLARALYLPPLRLHFRS